MAFSRRLGVVGILGACWFVAVGCNDDGDQRDPSADGGEGGEAPSAGKTSVAGSVNNAGKGGVGTAGKGGSGGTATAGAGGEITGGAAGSDAGNGGAAGSPEVPGGGAGGAGGADVGGAGGVGGDPGVPAAKACSNECEIDDDCVIGIDEKLKCNQANHRCEDPLACSTGADCVPGVNYWDLAPPCATSAECIPDFQACITWQGQGYCAYLELDGCLLPGEVGTSLPEFANAANQVSVCVVPAVCTDARECKPGCEASECGDGAGDTCDTVSHVCSCTLGSECTSTVCGADGLCQECVTADHCLGAQFGQDACVNGKCGCSATAVCPDTTEAGTPVCE